MNTTMQTKKKTKKSNQAKTNTKTTNRISVSDSKELFQLKRTIKDHAAAVTSLAQSAKDKSRAALAEAIACGMALIRAKEILGFGSFGKWLKENCNAVTERTAQRFMRLATHGSDLLSTGVGLRQAYISIGILKEEDETPAPNHQPEPVITDRALVSPQTPMANLMAKAQNKSPIQSAVPAISQHDALSRIRYLVNDLAIDITNKLNSNLATPAAVRAELKPLADFF